MEKTMQAKMQSKHYIRLLAMIVLSFASMYVLMYAMVNSLSNVYPSFNQFYMAGLMTAPMVIIEMLLMGGMYERKQWNMVIFAVAVAALALFWFGIRQQAAIDDRQFLKSMIPHHAGAILMCQQASIGDPEIRKLCGEIIAGQQAEIDQMKAKLQALR